VTAFIGFLVFGLIFSIAAAIAWDDGMRERKRKQVAQVKRSSMQAERAIFDITQQAQAEMVRILMASRWKE
jgi:Mg2+/citrate symporter